MAITKTKNDDTEEKSNTASNPTDLLGSHLKENKTKHFNFIEQKRTEISSGSILLDMAIGGSLKPGIHCFNGASGGGKSSSTLSFMDEFLKVPNRRAVYFQAERQLSEEHKKRTSIKFFESQNAKDWVDQSCYLYVGHIFEDIITLIRTLVQSTNTQYLFVIDSVNALTPEGDAGKSFSEAVKVAGGSLLSSHFLREMSLEMQVKGCYCFLIGQVRSKIKISQYEKVDPKLSNNSNGYAIDHYSDYVFEFQKGFSGDFIYRDASKKEVLGKYAKVILRKTNLENNESKTVSYPLKFNQVGKNSIWKEYEIMDMLIAWEKIKKDRAWMTPSEELTSLLTKNGFSLDEKLQEKSFLNYLGNNPELTDFLFLKCKNLLNCGRFE